MRNILETHDNYWKFNLFQRPAGTQSDILGQT